MITTLAAPPRKALWGTLALTVALLFVPDCCLVGRHAHGAAMAAFGPICHALR
jgi:hypothetical protein